MMMSSFSYVDRVVVGILAPLIKADLHLTDTQLGVISGTSFGLVYFAFTLPMGWIADRIKRVRLIGCCLAAWSIFTIICGCTTSFLQLLAARLGLGAAEAGGTTPAHSLLVDFFPPGQRARVLSAYSFSNPIGITLAGLFCWALVDSLGWRGVLILLGGLGFTLAILLMLLLREPPRGAFDLAKADTLPFRRSLAILLRKRAFALMLVAGGIFALVTTCQLFWIPSYLVRSFHISAAQSSGIFGAIALLSGLVGGALGGWVTDYLVVRRSPSAYLDVPIACVGFGIFPVVGMLTTPHLAIGITCYFLAATLLAASFGPILAAIQYLAPPGIRATASAMNSAVTIGAGMAVGVPLIGALSDRLAPAAGSDSLRLALLYALPLFLAASAALYFLASRTLVRDAGAAA